MRRAVFALQEAQVCRQSFQGMHKAVIGNLCIIRPCCLPAKSSLKQRTLRIARNRFEEMFIKLGVGKALMGYSQMRSAGLPWQVVCISYNVIFVMTCNTSL